MLIAGGGTGGHLYPGVAVAREIHRRDPGVSVTFVGTAQGIEARVIPREGFPFETIRSAGLKGKSLASLMRGLLLLPASAWDAWRVLSSQRPSVVIGVGGYSSGPVVGLAALRGIPTLLMEQNAAPGLTNRLLARVVRAAAVTYPDSLAHFGGRGFVSGNPVRPEFLVPDREHRTDDDGRVRVLVFGGSQGAHAINAAMADGARHLAASGGVVITHQTGERDLEMVRSAYRQAGLDARVEPFLYEMHREMRQADVVVCRAGATTIAELQAAGRAAVLVPLPTATDDHQRRNAQALVEAGAARMIEQAALSGERLAREIVALVGAPEERARLAVAARRMARPDAAGAIVDRVWQLAR